MYIAYIKNYFLISILQASSCHITIISPIVFKLTGHAATYMDLGHPDYVCQKCDSIMWYDERADKSHRPRIPKYSLCCQQGRVSLEKLKQPPELLKQLFNYRGGRCSNKFREKIRAYNSIFAFTSMGAKIDYTVNLRPGPYVYKISGQNYHKIGGLIPEDGEPPKFAQLYVHDTENEVQHRLRSLKGGSITEDIDATIVQNLKDMLDQHNRLAQAFRMARDRLSESDTEKVHIRLIGTRSNESRQYNIPTSTEIAALIVGDFGQSNGERDLIIEHKKRGFKKLPSYTHNSWQCNIHCYFHVAEMDFTYIFSILKMMKGKKAKGKK